MKKLIILTVLFSAVFTTATFAQAGPDPAAMLQQMKDKIKPAMIEKTGLSAAQADKIIEINFEFRMAASQLRDLSEADRSAKIAELKTARDKKYTEIPLTPEQIKNVFAFYEEFGRSMAPKN